MTKTYLDKQMENKEFKRKFNMEYKELCDNEKLLEMLDSPDEQGYIKRREYGLFR